MAPLRQNIGYQASMFSPTKGTAMIMNQEQALLKAQAQLDQLIESVYSAVEESRRIDQVERDLIAQLLDLGLTLLSLFIAQHGHGDLGETTETVEGRTVQRLPLKRLGVLDRLRLALRLSMVGPSRACGKYRSQPFCVP